MLVRWWGNSLTFTWNFVIGNIFIQRIDVISTKLCRCYKSQIKWIGGGFIGQFKAQQESLWDAYCNYAETIAYIFWWRPQFHNDGDVGDVKSNPVAKDAHAWRPAWKILVSIERIFPPSTTNPLARQSFRHVTKQKTISNLFITCVEWPRFSLSFRRSHRKKLVSIKTRSQLMDTILSQSVSKILTACWFKKP